MNNKNRRSYRWRAREACFQHYGAVCACCGEKEKSFLTFDHVDKDGAAHRRNIGIGGHLCEHLKRHNFPSGFQTLCHNCNWARSALGACPHQDPTKSWSERAEAHTTTLSYQHLTADQEAAIRAAYVPYRVSMRALAQQYGVSATTIFRVLSNIPVTD